MDHFKHQREITMENVKINVLRKPGVEPPKIAYKGTSAAFDIAAYETTVIPAHTTAVVPTGIRLSIPETEPYYMMIYMRSSFGFKKDIQNHIGIIDAGYTGDFGVKVFNHTDKDLIINAGERFAQVLVHKKIHIDFNDMSEEQFAAYEQQQNRGNNGFGSSSKYW